MPISPLTLRAFGANSRRSALRAAATLARRTAIATTLFALPALLALPPATARAGEALPAPGQNRPPVWANESDEERSVRVDETLEMRIEVGDPDKDPIKIDVAGLPAGMKIHRAGGPTFTGIELRWSPKSSDAGRHEISLTASDGQATITKTITVTVIEEWQSFLLPGLQYVVYDPAARATYGTFQGASAEILIASWIHRNENRGPSHGRVYVDMDVLKSSHEGMGAAFDLSLGFDLSIERNPSRRFLLPYFGLKFGGLLQKELPNEGFLYVTPQLGLYLYADRNFFVNGSLGYVLPMRADSFDALRGVRGTVGLNFSLW